MVWHDLRTIIAGPVDLSRWPSEHRPWFRHLLERPRKRQLQWAGVT